MSVLRKALAGYRWENVDVRAYKDEAAAPFRKVTRQVLASRRDPFVRADGRQPGQLRRVDVPV